MLRLDAEESEHHKDNYDEACDKTNSLKGQYDTIKADSLTTVWTFFDEVEPSYEELYNSDRFCVLWNNDYFSLS